MPAVAIIQRLREFCDDTAIGTLAMLVEREVSTADLIVSADQKRLFLDLWASTVFELGAEAADRSTQQLCVLATKMAADSDPRQGDIQATARSIVREPREADGWSTRIFTNLLTQALGPGAFDQRKLLTTPAAANLSMCVRYATYLMRTNKVRL
jgi:hypothetical protein